MSPAKPESRHSDRTVPALLLPGAAGLGRAVEESLFKLAETHFPSSIAARLSMHRSVERPGPLSGRRSFSSGKPAAREARSLALFLSRHVFKCLAAS